MRPEIVEIVWKDPTFFQIEGEERPPECLEYVAYGILQRAREYCYLDCAFPNTENTLGLKKIGFIIPVGCVKSIRKLGVIDEEKDKLGKNA